MTLPRNEPQDDRHFEVLYAGYFDLLVQIAIRKFRVPDSEAETLAHEVLMSYLRKSAEVAHPRPWLVGAICHASRHYWRLRGQTVAPEAEIELDGAGSALVRILDSLPDQLAAREALECLDPRCREILSMRYFEGCTVAEVAERLGVKPKSAKKLIAECLRRSEMLYSAKGRPR